MTDMSSVWSSHCVTKTRSISSLCPDKRHIGHILLLLSHHFFFFYYQGGKPRPRPPIVHSAVQSHQTPTTSTTCLHHAPLHLVQHRIESKRTESAAFCPCIYFIVCPSPTGPAVPIKIKKNDEKTISCHHLKSAWQSKKRRGKTKNEWEGL